MSIADIMQRDVASCPPTASIADAARLMRELDVGCVVVVDEGRLVVGVVTDRDMVLRGVANELAADLPVTRVATNEPVTVHADITLEDAARQMATRGCRRLPVVDDDRRVIGIVTLDDVLLAAGEAVEEILRALHHEHHEQARLASVITRLRAA